MNKYTLVLSTLVSTALCVLSLPAVAQGGIKLGFLVAQSGPLGVIGAEQKRGLDLALEHLGNKLGGLPVEVFSADSKGNPGAAVQEASKLIEKDRVDIVTGVTGSNELMAVVKPITGAGTFLVGTSGGPSPLAGKECNQNYFNVAFQNNQWSEGMGSYMSHIGVKRLYLIGMDYQGGWDLIAGARSTYKGEVVAQVFTPMAQLDFSAEIAQIRAAKPDAVFAGYGGGLAVAFVKQYAQAGLIKSIPLYSIDAFSDPLLFQAQGDAALGVMVSGHYSTELDKPINKRFVADFRAKYGRDPSTFAEQQYDAVMLIDSAVRAVKGNLTDKQALRAAFRKADFESLRGPFKFNNNHMPIQNIYVQRVDKRENGAMYLKLVWTAVEGAKDSFYKSCPMNW